MKTPRPFDYVLLHSGAAAYTRAMQALSNPSTAPLADREQLEQMALDALTFVDALWQDLSFNLNRIDAMTRDAVHAAKQLHQRGLAAFAPPTQTIH